MGLKMLDSRVQDVMQAQAAGQRLSQRQLYCALIRFFEGLGEGWTVLPAQIYQGIQLSTSETGLKPGAD